MKILGIETSCDETAIAVVEANGKIDSPSFKLLGSAVQSQIKLHAEYGGVFPALAKREHIKNLPIVLEEALKNADCKMDEVEMIAVTVGPGLEPALWTGINFAKSLSEKWNVPILPTNHMEGHIVSVLLRKTDEVKSETQFPTIALLISGGHTELVLLKNWAEKEVLGETLDDAVGEAFDKVARMLGLPYPGGPEISRLAEEAREKNMEMEKKLPRPMLHSGDFDFSFSGLKTAVLYYLRDKKEINKLAVAREFEDAVCEILVKKSLAAINEYNPKTFIVGGGVIANNKIRSEFLKMGEEAGVKVLIPDKLLTTDNAVMIAIGGYVSYISGKTKPLSAGEFENTIKAQGNLKIK